MLRTTFILRNVLMLVGPHLKYINFTRTCTIAKPGTIPVSSISCATSSLILSRIFLRGYSKYTYIQSITTKVDISAFQIQPGIILEEAD